MRREHLRAVIWPRSVQGPDGPVYRYVIVGMLVSDKPIEGFEGHNETVVDGEAMGLSTALEGLTPLENAGARWSDASSFLTALSRLQTKPR